MTTMECSLKAEKTAAAGALTGWRKMVSKAIHPESGVMEEDSVMERMKSLDAAWTRFDHAHYSLLNQGARMTDNTREGEQEDWEKQMEEYCMAKEEGLAVLKKAGMHHIKDFERPSPKTSDVPHSTAHHRRPSHISPQGSPTSERHHPTAHKERHHHRQHHMPQASSPSKDTHKSMFGCFQRPSFPDETGLDVAVRDDLVISGHKDFNSLYASNDTVTQSFTVNPLGAPNNSTTMCGCENINCPFCNIVESMKNRESDL